MTDTDPRGNRKELHDLLRLLVQRLTKQRWATTLQKQIDVGKAIVLANQVEDFPDRLIVRRTLAELLRELGKRRPDLHRYVVILERAAVQLGEDMDQS